MRLTKWRPLTTALAVTLVLTACGGASESESSTETTTPTTSETTEANVTGTTQGAVTGTTNGTDELADITLNFWIMGDTATAFEDLVSGFTAETGIKVQVDAIPWDAVNDRLTTAVASGEGPDVTQIGLSLLPTFIAGEALMDVSDLVGSYPNLAATNFPSDIMATLNPGGATYSFPWVSDTRVLFYRSDILAEAGYSEPPTTWAELLDMASVLADRGSTKYGYYIPQWDAPLPVAYTWQAGGDVIAPDGSIDLDTPEFRDAVDHYLAFYEAGVVPTAGDWDQALGFITGDAPMLVSGPYLAGAINGQAPELEGSWGVTTVPTGENNTSLFAGSNVGVWSGSENPEAALALINYLARPETQLAWYAAVNELPAVSAALEELKAGDDATVAVYAAQLANSRLLPLNPAWDAVGQEILTMLNSVALTGADKAQALADLFDSVARIVEG
ncbi:N-acetyl-D-glucosamine ABC transporter, substrate-binding protein [hydrothermal vent metagenome]|uniref:N-acetyl-D-glucosamine ABC transporter, substrate-binding protein n=1 Tax=hydrothermal vent metagenome TaxID=652676 RepID=A0A3B0S2N2_9ZZZZ